MSYAILFSVTLAMCFAAQNIVLRWVGGRTIKSESNYFSSLARIQTSTKGKPHVLLLGSSITGRLPDRSQGFDGVACMGSDGGNAVEALRAIDEGFLPSAPVLLIEANTLYLALKPGESEIGRSIKSPWFRLGCRIACISATARPSAFVYSSLIAHKLKFGTKPISLPQENLSGPRRIDNCHGSDLSNEQRDAIATLAPILQRLRSRGTEPFLVWLPPARPRDQPPPAWILELARQSQTPWWDLPKDLPTDSIRLTDGVHMDASSAELTVAVLLRGIEAQER
jgi:hypothetical protein